VHAEAAGEEIFRPAALVVRLNQRRDPGGKQLFGHATQQNQRGHAEALRGCLVRGAEAIVERFLEIVLGQDRQPQLRSKPSRQRRLPAPRRAADDDQ
jgi:hypothetical protein